MSLEVYDINGRFVTTLVSGDVPAGDHSVSWDGKNAEGHPMAPGIYLYRLETPERTITRKMALMR
jgi:flagellar hook assembly protein FlgD